MLGDSFLIIQLLFNGDYLCIYIEVVSVYGMFGVVLFYVMFVYIVYLLDCCGVMSGRMWGNIVLVLIVIILIIVIVKVYGYVIDKFWYDDLLISMENQVWWYMFL